MNNHVHLLVTPADTDGISVMMQNLGRHYVWSSYRSNGLGVPSRLMTPHEEYLALGKTRDERLEKYRSLFRAHLDEELVTEIRKSVNTGLVLGSERFKDEVESNLKRRVRLGTPGLPRKQEGNQGQQ